MVVNVDIEDLSRKVEIIGDAIAGKKGRILVYIFKHEERTYDQLSIAIEGNIKKHLSDLEGLGFIKSQREFLHPLKLEDTFFLASRGMFLMRSLEAMLRREEDFVNYFVLPLVEVKT